MRRRTNITGRYRIMNEAFLRYGLWALASLWARECFVGAVRIKVLNRQFS